MIRSSGKFESQMRRTRSGRSRRSRVGIVTAVVSVGLTMALVSGSVPASATAPSEIGTAQPISGTSQLNGIACNDDNFCVAVGTDFGEGVVVPIIDGTAGSAVMVPGTDLLSAVSLSLIHI